ncbi:MAG: alkaline phosphatase family protein [Acidimicrobiia bacterium]|nr:alkaline phosphatase family protein [Acidimicrobiia bacterium]
MIWKRIAILSILAAALLPAQRTAPPARTKLILALVVDQFRYDYLTRFRDQYNSGIDRMLRTGAVFTNAHYEHFPTVTAIGHATFLSGATPSISGIVGNEWYDRVLKRQVTSVFDPDHKQIGAGDAAGASPRNLLVSTIPDELKMSGRAPSKAFGLSIKDRSAILPVGRMADGAFWFDNKTGNFVSSTYFYEKLPAWVEEFNRSRVADKFLGSVWGSIEDPKAKPFLAMAPQLEEKYWGAMQRTPFGNDLLELLAERAVEAEKLGQGPGTDLLAVSFSSNDYVGHDEGPDSPLVRDISIRTDRVLGKLFAFLDKKIGMQNVLVVMTADHGVAPLPEVMQKRKMPGGRIPEKVVHGKVEERLARLYGEGKWVVGKSGPAPYLDHELIAAKKLDLIEVRKQAAEAVREIPQIYRVYTRDQLASGTTLEDQVDRRVRAGFNPWRAGDLFIVIQPYWLFEEKGTSHGTPYNYDSHVPVIFMGPGIKPGRFHGRAAVNDIAPTLATLLDVETPSGSVGRVLEEALAAR